MQKISYNDAFGRAVGLFKLVGRNRNGDIVLDYSDNNMIVTVAKSVMARVISDPSADGYIISKIGIGENGDGPNLDDTYLTNSFTNDLIGSSFPESGQVKFDWFIDYSEANGLEVREFGLLTANDTLFARKTRGVITKDDDLSLEGSWTIIF